MAFCSSCGAQVPDGNAFCNSCGKPLTAQSSPAATGSAPPASIPAPSNPSASPTEGLQENVAGLLCYVLWWVTGIIFLIIDKRPFVKFHAAQSIVVFGGITIIYYIIGAAFATSIAFGGLGMGWTFGYSIFMLVRLISLIAWIFLMVKAYQHVLFRVPIAADIADSLAGQKK
jgi:uncharacterized membrane protein